MAKTQAPKQSLAYRVCGHGALLLLSVVFVLPFVWLVSTSLKVEDDQFGDPTDPRVLLPKARFIQRDGEAFRVVRSGPPITAPASVVVWDAGPNRGERALLPDAEIVDGTAEVFVTAQGRSVAQRVGVTVVQSVPASEAEPWQRVEAPPVKGLQALAEPTAPRWWGVVSDASIEERVHPYWANYTQGLAGRNFGRYYLNTTLVTAATIFLTVLSCAFAAYGFSILRWRGRDTLFGVMLATMMLPAMVTLIPVFFIFKELGWVNTYRPLVVPAAFGVPFFTFILRQFFLGIPRSLIDAARIDGCSELRIWWQIVMPLSKPALMTVGLFAFLGAWNDFERPLVYLIGESKYTLSLALALFTGEYGSDFGALMAMTVLTILPVLVFFFFAQKTFIQGVKLSGTKG